MFFTYLRRELRQRLRQTLLVAFALGTSIGLVIVVSAASAGISDAQKTVLSGLYGIGTDITVTKTVLPTQNGQRFDFGPMGQGATGSTAINTTRLDLARFAGTFDQAALSQVTGTKGVTKAAGTLKLSQVLFKGTIAAGSTSTTTAPTPSAAGTTQPSIGNPGGDSTGGPGRGFGGGNFNIDMTSIEGVDPSSLTTGPLSGVIVKSGRNFQSTDANSAVAVLDSTYAKTNTLAVGGKVKVKGVDYAVIGIVAPSSASAETSSNFYIPLAKAQEASGKAGLVTNIYVSADSSSNIASIQSSLKTLLPDATVSSQADLAQNLSGSLSSASSLVNSLSKWLSIIVLLVAFFIAILFTSSGVTRRTRELGTLKAIGWKTNRIVRQILGESLVTSGIGAFIGMIVGVVGIFIVNAVAPTLSASLASPRRFGGGAGGFTPPAGGLTAPAGGFTPPAGGFGGRGTGFGRAAANATTLKLHIGMNVSTLVIGVLIALAGGLIAGTYGSWRASKLSPAVALRSVA